MEFLVGCPVEDVNLTTLVNKHLLYRAVLKLYGDDNGVILLVVHAVEIIINKGNGRHAAFVVRVGYVINGLEVTKVFLSY